MKLPLLPRVSRSQCRMLLALAVLAVPAVAPAQVYKCVDRAGRITYQQQPCPDTHTGGPLGLTVNNGSGRASDAPDVDWAEKARQKEVVPGMPRTFVIQAYGYPQEMRTSRPGESAAEVWVYNREDLNKVIGFKGGVVAWSNDNPAEDLAAANNATPRQRLVKGASCVNLDAELGASESVASERDAELAREVLRYTWAPSATDPERMVVTCDQDTVVRIDRQMNP